jgi:peptidoglycan lytic transglycosylase A
MTAYCRVRALALSFGLFGATCLAHGQAAGPITFPDTQYEPLEWQALDGWAGDDHAAAFATFLTSCRKLGGSRQLSAELARVSRGLREVCRRAEAAVPLDDGGARRFFETNFRPVRIVKLGDSQGFVTGYYEPVVAGSTVATAEFTAPLYRRPSDLVTPDSRTLGDDVALNGLKVGRLAGPGRVVPYYTRGEIEDGALKAEHLEICWLRNEVDVLFAQIQGSARIDLQNGSMLRVNYDGYNGWPYTPIGRVLIDRGYMTKDQVSMQHIREWASAHAGSASDVVRQNKSYVFFKVTGLSSEDEPEGAEGVPLAPGRSIAVDRSLHAYGTPFFIDADLPIADGRAPTKFQRLVIAQDTGSAIVGPARADIYFGAGRDAARIAGRIKSHAQIIMLLPRALDPLEAGHAMPLPPPRPSSTAVAGLDGRAAADSPGAALKRTGRQTR